MSLFSTSYPEPINTDALLPVLNRVHRLATRAFNVGQYACDGVSHKFWDDACVSGPHCRAMAAALIAKHGMADCVTYQSQCAHLLKLISQNLAPKVQRDNSTSFHRASDSARFNACQAVSYNFQSAEAFARHQSMAPYPGDAPLSEDDVAAIKAHLAFFETIQ